MQHIWLSLSMIFIGVYLSKYLSHKTNTVDVLWFIVIGAILGNIGLVHENHALEFLGDIGIVLVMFALGFEEHVASFIKGVKKAWVLLQ